MTTTYSPVAGIDTLTTAFPVPGFGLVPINAFVLHGEEPLLVDTGAPVDSDDFLATLSTVIDPGDLRWIWLTHTDFDHIGSLRQLLELNPDLKVITTFLGVGIMNLFDPLPLDRVHLLNPGQQLALTDRTLTAFKPPAFDNPCTTGFFDDRTGTLFSSDCFGALLADVPTSAVDLSDEELRQGQVFWATVDSPWLHKVGAAELGRELKAMADFSPKTVLSSHLPSAPGAMLPRLAASIEAATSADPFMGPDQEALMSLLSAMPPGDH